jgi:hypothetical protein
MNLTKVHLFVVLLLALVLCSFFGGACSDDLGLGLEGFMNSPYHGNGQYSDRYSSYAGMYSDTKSSAKTQDALNDRKNKPLPHNLHADDDDVTTTKYAPYYKNHRKINQGIRARQILPGNEDLYVLKSNIVPPVCPACPASKCNKESSDTSKCPPCPPCARCPEPAFECKKVPNYDRVNDDSMPHPVLNSFSQFGI